MTKAAEVLKCAQDTDALGLSVLLMLVPHPQCLFRELPKRRREFPFADRPPSVIRPTGHSHLKGISTA